MAENELVAFLISGVSSYVVHNCANVGARATFQSAGKNIQSSCQATGRAELNVFHSRWPEKLVV